MTKNFYVTISHFTDDDYKATIGFVLANEAQRYNESDLCESLHHGDSG